MAKYSTRKELLDALNATPSLSGFLRNTTYDDFAQNDDLGPLPELWVGIRKLVMSGDFDAWMRGLGLYAQTIAALRSEASEDRSEHALDLDGNCPACDAEDETLVETTPGEDDLPACNYNVSPDDCPGCKAYEERVFLLEGVPAGIAAFAGLLK